MLHSFESQGHTLHNCLRLHNQAINKGVAPDLPALYGARPICKDFLKGECRRGRLCRFRHLSPRQYDMEMSGYEYESYHQDYG